MSSVSPFSKSLSLRAVQETPNLIGVRTEGSLGKDCALKPFSLANSRSGSISQFGSGEGVVRCIR